MKILKPRVLPAGPEQIGGVFTRVGWIGFWLRLVLAAIPTAVLVYVLVIAPFASTQRAGFGVIDFAAPSGLLVLLFTLVWFYHDPRLRARMAIRLFVELGCGRRYGDSARRPCGGKRRTHCRRLFPVAAVSSHGVGNGLHGLNGPDDSLNAM